MSFDLFFLLNIPQIYNIINPQIETNPPNRKFDFLKSLFLVCCLFLSLLAESANLFSIFNNSCFSFKWIILDLSYSEKISGSIKICASKKFPGV